MEKNGIMVIEEKAVWDIHGAKKTIIFQQQICICPYSSYILEKLG